jgi:hypothetical protein
MNYSGLPTEPGRSLTKNESIDLKALALGPHRHPAGEQRSGHCGKVHRFHRYPRTVREQPGELLQRGRPEELRELCTKYPAPKSFPRKGPSAKAA